MNNNNKTIPVDVVDKAIEVYKRPGMVWQNVPAVLANEFSMMDGDQLYHNHALCSAANDNSTYEPKRKKRGFISPAKIKALDAALNEFGITGISARDLVDKAVTKLPAKKNIKDKEVDER